MRWYFKWFVRGIFGQAEKETPFSALQVTWCTIGSHDILIKQITTTLEIQCYITTSKWKWVGGASRSCGKYFTYNTSQTEVSDGGKNTPMLSLIRNNDKQLLLLQMQIQNLEYPPPCFNARGDDVAWHHSVKMQSFCSHVLSAFQK